VVKRRFKRALCLIGQPGRSILLFKVLLYNNVPDKTFIYTVTIKDVVLRIKLYQDTGYVTYQLSGIS